MVNARDVGYDPCVKTAFFSELKRRNVVRVAAAYVVIAWIIAQVSELALDSFEAPDWVMKTILLLLALGLPLALFFAWAFELTPEGIKREKDVDRSETVTGRTGSKPSYVIVGLAAIAIAYFIWAPRTVDKDVAAVDREATETVAALKDAQAADERSVAVLPFVNMSSDPEQEYFSDGITEDIITALSRSPWLFVISRNSSFIYRGKMVDIRQVSRELGARYILEGSVRKAGNRIRVTAQLIDGSVGSHVWAEKYDGELQDIFDLQDQITQQVVAAILTQIQMYVGENTKRLERPDVVTWDLLARGWKLFYELTKESLEKAETLFRRAVSLTPTSCDAHHLLAGVLIHRVQMGYIVDEKAAISESYELAKRAIVLDERNEYAHWILGVIQLTRRQHELAVTELKRAIELNPNCSLAFGSLGTVLNYSGEPDESIKNNEIAIRLNPRDISIFFRYSGLAMAHFVAGRYSEAVQWALKCVNRKPSWRVGHAVLAASLAQLDLIEEAKAAVDNYLEIIPDETISKLRFLPFKNHIDARRLEEGLQKAGLPE